MSLLLDVITAAASAKADQTSEHQSNYPIPIDPETGFKSLHYSSEAPPNPTLLVYPVSGFKFSHLDTQLAQLNNKLFTELTRYLKNTRAVSADEFEVKVCKFLKKVGNLRGVRDVLSNNELIKRFGSVMGRDVAGVVVEGCVLVENWDWVELLILNNWVPCFSYSKLIDQLIEKKKTNLICECVKNFSDLKAADILSILRYFLVPSRDAYATMNGIAKEWESQAVKAVERVSNKTLIEKRLVLAKTFAIVLMVAYDGFSDSELCLHYMFKTMSVDELVLTSAISKLNGNEIMALVRYLGKWLRKYEAFPQAFALPEDVLVSGPKACNWFPKIEDVISCLGLVIDEHFSTLVLHEQFHDEMRSLDELIELLVLDGRICCSATNVIDNLKTSLSLRSNPSQETE